MTREPWQLPDSPTGADGEESIDIGREDAASTGADDVPEAVSDDVEVEEQIEPPD